MDNLVDILIEFKDDKITLKEAKQKIVSLFSENGNEIENKEKYKSAWSYINQTYDGKSTQLAIIDKAIRIASGLDKS